MRRPRLLIGSLCFVVAWPLLLYKFAGAMEIVSTLVGLALISTGAALFWLEIRGMRREE